MALKLRGQGPKTFISYAFGNTLAPKLAERLRDAGFQVTLVVDTSLLGEPSLSQALEHLIENAELVVPILDAKANTSNWVLHELKIAHRLGRVIMPVVQDEDSLPDLVRDIPYLTEQTLEALIPAALSRYALLPLDPTAPYQLATEPLRHYLQRDTEFIRVILDADDYCGQMLDSASAFVAQVTENQPELKNFLEAQVRNPLEWCVREMDHVQPLLPRFRSAVEHALHAYGPERVERSIPAWQRLTRLVMGAKLLAVASFLPASTYPAYWHQAARLVDVEAKKLESMKLSASATAPLLWAIEFVGNEATDGWLELIFQSAHGHDFRCYMPSTESITDGVQFRGKPELFLESYQWADFGLPQLLKRALLLTDGASDPSLEQAMAWNLSEYQSARQPA